MLHGEGKKVAKKAGNFLHAAVHGAGARSRAPRSVNCSRLMPGPGCAELQLTARGPPVSQEKGVWLMWCLSYRLGSKHIGFIIITISCFRIKL